jgi:hypothetical protein
LCSIISRFNMAEGLAFSSLKDSLNDAAAKANATGCLWGGS